ncbi:MAG: T9SS type A sorting domain-containing protein [Saprospiraceae bacterium]
MATGIYPIEITATDGTNESFNTVILRITEGVPTIVTNPLPANNTVNVSTSLQLTWDNTIGDDFYHIQVATDEAFTSIIAEDLNLENPVFNLSFLDILTTYYWRVRSSNSCGESPWSEVWNFITADISCGIIASEDTPIIITEGANGVYTSTISINNNALITDLNVTNLDITHSYVGDVSATLESPEGIIIQLFDRPGVPASQFGCDNADLFLSFDDSSFNPPSDLEEACDDNPAVGGDFEPIDELSILNGENALGDWILTVRDEILGDGGSINGWNLEICTSEFQDITVIPSEDSKESCTGTDVQFTITLGDDFAPSGVNLNADGIPTGSVAIFDINPAMPGDVVVLTISNITTTGNFMIQIEANDGTNNGSTLVELTTETEPEMAILTSPPDVATNVSTTATLEWDASPNAINYQVEVATDNSFATIVEGTTTANNSFTIPTPLDFNTNYAWRVIANNPCGETFSTASSFTTETDVAVEELEGNKFQIDPNPTTGNILVSFAKAINKELTLEVYSIDGKLLQQSVHVNGVRNIPVQLDYSSGIYILRLKTDKAAVARRVLVQR